MANEISDKVQEFFALVNNGRFDDIEKFYGANECVLDKKFRTSEGTIYFNDLPLITQLKYIVFFVRHNLE
jgi:hypothetical protein